YAGEHLPDRPPRPASLLDLQRSSNCSQAVVPRTFCGSALPSRHSLLICYRLIPISSNCSESQRHGLGRSHFGGGGRISEAWLDRLLRRLWACRPDQLAVKKSPAFLGLS